MREVFGDNGEMLSKLSIIEGDGDHKMVRMANLAIVGSFKVRIVMILLRSSIRYTVHSILLLPLLKLTPTVETIVALCCTPASLDITCAKS